MTEVSERADEAAHAAAYEWTPAARPERLLALPLFTPRPVSLAE